jgi:DNA-directed RNA polymerase subunit M/transcription elongation factor TFIIS
MLPLRPECYREGYNLLRKNKIRMFHECLSSTQLYLNLWYTQKYTLVSELEKSCLKETIKLCKSLNIDTVWSNNRFTDVYHGIAARVAANIDTSGSVCNINLINDLLFAVIKAEEIPKMTSIEMFPAKYKEIQNKINQSANVEFSVVVTRQHTCGKCKNNECVSQSVQTRSLDEAASLKIRCVSCGHQWTKS